MNSADGKLIRSFPSVFRTAPASRASWGGFRTSSRSAAKASVIASEKRSISNRRRSSRTSPAAVSRDSG
jgi:hypothetical protein